MVQGSPKGVVVTIPQVCDVPDTLRTTILIQLAFSHYMVEHAPMQGLFISLQNGYAYVCGVGGVPEGVERHPYTHLHHRAGHQAAWRGNAGEVEFHLGCGRRAHSDTSFHSPPFSARPRPPSPHLPPSSERAPAAARSLQPWPRAECGSTRRRAV